MSRLSQHYRGRYGNEQIAWFILNKNSGVRVVLHTIPSELASYELLLEWRVGVLESLCRPSTQWDTVLESCLWPSLVLGRIHRPRSHPTFTANFQGGVVLVGVRTVFQIDCPSFAGFYMSCCYLFLCMHIS
jgi:hypothetical protein